MSEIDWKINCISTLCKMACRFMYLFGELIWKHIIEDEHFSLTYVAVFCKINNCFLNKYYNIVL